jgi:prophage regulatory protein
MPNSLRRFLRLRTVEAVTGLAKTTIYARIAEGKFPAPVPLGEGRNSPVGWPEDEIAAWQAERLAKRDAGNVAG